jgi:hypothetical protein
MYLTLRKWKYAPIMGLVGQVVWVVYVVLTRQWGLMPGVLLYGVIYATSVKGWLKA